MWQREHKKRTELTGHGKYLSKYFTPSHFLYCYLEMWPLPFVRLLRLPHGRTLLQTGRHPSSHYTNMHVDLTLTLHTPHTVSHYMNHTHTLFTLRGPHPSSHYVDHASPATECVPVHSIQQSLRYCLKQFVWVLYKHE